MKWILLFFITVIGAGLLAGCGKKEEPTQGNGAATLITTESRQKAASLDGLTYVKGNAVTLAEDTVFVVEFWATWCPPCKDSIPHLTALQKQYKDNGVTVIGVSNESVDTVKPFVEKMAARMAYTVAVDAGGQVGDGYMRAYNQNGIPTAFIVDSNGKVAWVGHPLDGLDAALAKVVAQ